MFKAPIRRPATAMLVNKMFEFLRSSFLCFTTTITNAFKIIVAGDAMYNKTTKIQEGVVLFKFHVASGEYKQRNTDLMLGEEFVLLSML